MKRFNKKKIMAVGAAAVVIAGTSGIAYAYWTSTGSGPGTATTGSASNWGVVVTATGTSPALTPGGPSDSYSVTVTNNSTGHQELSSLATVLDSVSGNPGACTIGDYSATNPALTAIDLGPGGTATSTFTVSMTDTASNQDGCFGATVNFEVDAS